jgi:hypothetical protein
MSLCNVPAQIAEMDAGVLAEGHDTYFAASAAQERFLWLVDAD